MGLLSRTKGKVYERHIASLLRERWPQAVVRRASQAERASNPDVFVEGTAPDTLKRLWLELQDARTPTPLVKLGQAEKDAAEWRLGRNFGESESRLPVVVWHRTGARSSQATMRLSTLMSVWSLWVDCQSSCRPPLALDTVVTLDLEQLLDQLELCP